MKYGESMFDVLYLLFAIISGVVLLRNARNENEKKMGLAVLILGCGDAFHLVPRVLHYFAEDLEQTAFLGIGKLVTSITMTLFYVLLYRIWMGYWHVKERRFLTMIVWALTVTRMILCCFPQNRWLSNESTVDWGIIRNIPFTAMGLLITILYWKKRRDITRLKWVWMLVTLSFAFYLPVAVGAGVMPVLGMLMLPKTICYILLIVLFLQAVLKDDMR